MILMGSNNALLEKAKFHFNNEEFDLVVDSYQRALNITPLNKEETEKLNIASSIILLTSKMQQF